jgi:hypothetical protein
MVMTKTRKTAMQQIKNTTGLLAIFFVFLNSQFLAAQTTPIIPIMQGFDLDVAPLGQAQLDTSGGRLVVSNIGSSGLDGVSFHPGDIVIPVPSTGRFIPPVPNFEQSFPGSFIVFDQVGGVAFPGAPSQSGQIQSQFMSTHVQTEDGPRLNVGVNIGLGQTEFMLELFRGDVSTGEPVFLPSGSDGGLTGLATEVVDLISYDIIVPNPGTIILTGTLARPSEFFHNGIPVGFADRARISNVPPASGGGRQLTSFEAVNIRGGNLPENIIAIDDVQIRADNPSTHDNIPIEPLGTGDPAVVLNRNGQLVVSNIGSSGQDGVRYIAPPIIPFPSTGRFIPPIPNISLSDQGFSAAFDQVGGLDGEPNQIQSHFGVSNNGEQLQVDLRIGLGQTQFNVELFDRDGNSLTGGPQLAKADSTTGQLLANISTGIVDLSSYDITVSDPTTITLTGSFANPTFFNIDGQAFDNVSRATISNADATRRLTSFESVDIRAANTPNNELVQNQVLILDTTAPTFDDIAIVGLGQGEPAVALNRNGQLVVSNIGSSGQDGVSFIAPRHIPIPSTGRFIPPPNNFERSAPGAEVQFQQIGGLDGVDDEIQSQFTSTNIGGQLQVDVVMGLNQRFYMVELFLGDELVTSQTAPSDTEGRLAVPVFTEVVDLTAYDVIVANDRMITLTGTLARPTLFTIGSPGGPQQEFVADRARISNVPNPDGGRQLTSFGSIDVRGRNTPNSHISIDEVHILDDNPRTFENIPIVGLGEGQPSVRLNRGGGLVVSNIGSSGEGGVRFIAPTDIPFPSTGRFIPPPINFSDSDLGDYVQFDQIGGLDGTSGEIQSHFRSTNTGEQLQVDVSMGMGQSEFLLEILDGNTLVASTNLPSNSSGGIDGVLATEVVDLSYYDIMVQDPRQITLTGTLARPSSFFFNGQPITDATGQNVLGDRARISNVPGTNGRQLTSFEVVDLTAANTNIAVNEVMILDNDIREFENIPIKGLGDGQPGAALNRNGQLVVSNIGSSGLDGVSFIVPDELPIPIPSQGRFIAPDRNISTTEAGFTARFDQIGGLDGVDGQLQSQFSVRNNGQQLQVDIGMGMGQKEFNVELLDSDGYTIVRAVAPSVPDESNPQIGRLGAEVLTDIVDFSEYNIIVESPTQITLVGTFADPATFTIDGQRFDNVRRAAISNVPNPDGGRQLSSFGNIDIFSSNAPVDVLIFDEVIILATDVPTFGNLPLHEPFPVEPIGQGELGTALNRNGNLVVSNIGSSGQDGVRFIAPSNIPLPGTGRFMPPPDNFGSSDPGAQVRFDQIGGLDGVDGQLQSSFTSTNVGDQLAVDVFMGLGQREFRLRVFDGDVLVGETTLPSDTEGRLAAQIGTEVVDLISYDIIVPNPRTITLTGTLARPSSFFVDGQDIGLIGDRAEISNILPELSGVADVGDGPLLTSFGSIDIFGANTDIEIGSALIIPGQPGDYPDGDFDFSGETGLADLNLVLFNWDQLGSDLPVDWVHRRPGPTASVGLVELNSVLFTWGEKFKPQTPIVPEPTTMLLTAVGLLAMVGVSRRRQR